MPSKWGGRKVARLRAVLFARDYVPSHNGWRCILCKHIETNPKALSVEHIKPRSHGGTDALENLALSHKSCNYARGNKPIETLDQLITTTPNWIETINAQRG